VLTTETHTAMLDWAGDKELLQLTLPLVHIELESTTHTQWTLDTAIHTVLPPPKVFFYINSQCPD